jgi:hypothetical protein
LDLGIGAALVVAEGALEGGVGEAAFKIGGSHRSPTPASNSGNVAETEPEKWGLDRNTG